MNLSLSPALDKLINLKIEKVENILVVRQHNQLGDMLCSLTLYAALKKKFPDSRITLVAAKTYYEIPFYEINPYLDRVITFDKQNSRTILNFFRSLRERKYQLGIVPSTIKVSRTSHIINFLSGAKVRVGVKSITGVRNPSHTLLNVKSDFSWENSHQLERNLDVVKQINCDLSEEDKLFLKFRYSDEDKRYARNFIEENFPGNHRKIIGFHPGAGKADNMWSTKKFTELIIKLFNKYNNYVLLTMGKIDGAVISTVEDELKKHNIDYKILGPIPIKKQGAILSLVDLYITNDTGSMHIAGFSDAKMISLFGPTNPNEWAPQGINKHFIKSRTGNINDISVDEVFNLSKKILEEEK
ncbi:MAG: glycosyltransferase family 9 protein [Ignavibacteriaceae bacterium]|nr:glycosyltransferase family 9 protein [Ignavibacteriaceae bacterium]